MQVRLEASHYVTLKDTLTPSLGQRIQTWFQNIRRSLQVYFKSIPHPYEIRVWQTQDPSGGVSWHIYDPVTQQSFTSSCEQEILVWLDTRYYSR